MNGSQVVKRTLPLIIVLAIIIAIAVSCTIFNKDKAIPGIKNPDEIYFEVKESGRTFSMTNQEIYDQLRNNYGLSMLIEMVDIDLLKLGNNYYDAVTEEEIDEAIAEDKFPSGQDDLSEEEIEEAEEKFNEDMLVNNGLINDTQIRNHYRLILAKRKYAASVLEEEIKDADELAKEDDKNEPYFTEKEYETQYKADYQNGYWAIVVPFNSKEEGDLLLKQLGVTVHEKDTSITGDFTKWVKTIDDEEVTLTASEIAEVFVDMYNAVNSYKVAGYPENTLSLTKGVQYDFDEEGKYTFNTEIASEEENQSLNEFYYTFEKITEYNSSIQNYLKVSMKNYDNHDGEEITSTTTFYTPTIRSYVNNTLYVYILKIAEEIAPELDEVRDEVYDTLFDKVLTDNYISKKMLEFRESKGFAIYDEMLEENYQSSILSYDIEHKTTKAASDNLVAKVGEVEYSADMLFNHMDARFGMSITLNRVNYFRLLNNPDMNKIFDYYTPDLKEKDRIHDADKWQDIKNSIRGLRDNFLANAFANYGYPSTYGWHNFIKDYFGVIDEEEMKYYFLYQEVVAEFTEGLSSVEELDADSALWNTYQEKMQGIADEYFSVTGIHILISVNDEAGSPTDPENWTSYQTQLAEELYAEIWKYYEAEPG
ncbi:MAG: hypothetical protein PHX62_02410, partial [Bacilli bacterium]|nr:hypothetical protein [Bacilli bacterium]